MNILTRPTLQPTPRHEWDWCAYDDDTYEPGCPIGYGATPTAALIDWHIEAGEPEGCELWDELLGGQSQ